MLHQGRFDLAGLDAEASQLDLLVVASEEKEPAVGGPGHAVARAIAALGRVLPRRGGSEPFVGEVGAPPVAVGDGRPDDEPMPGDSSRHATAERVEHFHPHAGDGTANSHRA